MNGQRIIRKYFERITDGELHELYQAAMKDDSQEATCIRYLAASELAVRMEKKMPEIKKALEQLGADGYATTEWIAFGRIKVYLDFEYFGVWDTTRKTFVD